MEKVTAGRDALGEFAPEFARFNDDVLFGEVWSREDKLSPRDRSMITVSARHRKRPHRERHRRQLAEISHIPRKRERSHRRGDGGDAHPARVLCRLAESMGGIPHGKRSLRRG